MEDISSGRSLESIRAEMALIERLIPKKINLLKFWNWDIWKALGNSLTTVVAITVAISGIFFSYFQYKQNNVKTVSDEKVSRADIINKLAPSLTSENAQIRTLAFKTLLNLDQLTSEELYRLVDNNVLVILASETDNKEVRKNASAWLAEQAGYQREVFSKASDKGDNEGAAKALKDAEQNAEKAVSFDPENVNAAYQLARASQELGKNDKAIGIFEAISPKIAETDEKGSRVNLNLTILYDKTKNKDVCAQVKKTVDSFEKINQLEYLTKPENEPDFNKIWRNCTPQAS
jgi:tetratricopeptide (TPR) repeat protein